MMGGLEPGFLLIGGDGQPRFATPVACALLGCESFADLVRRWGEIRVRLRALLEPPESGPPSGVTRADLSGPGGEEVRSFRVAACQLGSDGAGGEVILIENADVTAALESELGLALQMRALASLHAVLAHDLKAPLNAMTLNLELLRQTLEQEGAGDPARRERQLRYIGIVHEELFRLDEQLGGFFRHSASSDEAPRPVDLVRLVRETADLLAAEARRRRITLEVLLPPGGVSFPGRSGRLKQALLNMGFVVLATMEDGGTVQVELMELREQLRLRVESAGAGMPTALPGRLCEVHLANAIGVAGYGLRLARSVAEAHGGSLRVEAALGAGTCIALYLPRIVPQTA